VLLAASFTPANHDERRNNDDEQSDNSRRLHKLLRNTDGAAPLAVHEPVQRLLAAMPAKALIQHGRY